MSQYRFKTKPWSHQFKAFKYLYTRDTAALFTDMGTGKTKVLIDVIQNRGFSCVLVVSTKKSCDVWEEQFEIHGIEGQFSVFNLKNMSKVKILKTLGDIPILKKQGLTNETVVLIINYDMIWRSPLDKKLMYKKLGIDCVICDESHRIKGATSRASRYLSRVGDQVSNRYILTGTPLAENPLDAYGQYRFLDKKVFGLNYGNFRDTYENIDLDMTARMGFRMRNKKDPWKNLDLLHDKMYSCAFYIESDVELPSQTDIPYMFRMDPKVEVKYNELLKEGIIMLNSKYTSIKNALSLILRLQQMTSGYAPVEDIEGNKSVINMSSARIDNLEMLIEELPPDEPLVVFCNFKKDLKDIRKLCEKLEIGYSEVSGSHDTLKDWLKGDTRVIAVQYSSGSESIDLTRARYCVYYSMTRRLGLYEQSRKRVHRPGQTRPVYYYHFMAKLKKGKSIDEKMYEALKAKKDIVDYVTRTGLS